MLLAKPANESVAPCPERRCVRRQSQESTRAERQNSAVVALPLHQRKAFWNLQSGIRPLASCSWPPPIRLGSPGRWLVEGAGTVGHCRRELRPRQLCPGHAVLAERGHVLQAVVLPGRPAVWPGQPLRIEHPDRLLPFIAHHPDGGYQVRVTGHHNGAVIGSPKPIQQQMRCQIYTALVRQVSAPRCTSATPPAPSASSCRMRPTRPVAAAAPAASSPPAATPIGIRPQHRRRTFFHAGMMACRREQRDASTASSNVIGALVLVRLFMGMAFPSNHRTLRHRVRLWTILWTNSARFCP